MKPNTISFPTLALTLNLAVLTGAIIAGYSEGHSKRYFTEGEVVTFLSSFNLVAISLFCWIVYEKEKLADSVESLHPAGSIIWALMSAGFLFLAFDETMEIHENADFFIHKVFGLKETAITDRLDDMLILFYGVVGLTLFIRFRGRLWPYIDGLRPLIGGVLLLVLMVLFDALTNRRDIISERDFHTLLSIAEDIFKVLAELMFLVAAYTCWTRTVRS